jgi:hypothetical protein
MRVDEIRRLAPAPEIGSGWGAAFRAGYQSVSAAAMKVVYVKPDRTGKVA